MIAPPHGTKIALVLHPQNRFVNERHPHQHSLPRIGSHRSTVSIRHHVVVILEHALLAVRPGTETEFESMFAEARLIIAATPGFERLTLSRCIERPSAYLLLVQWRRLEDHTEGFRGSPQYQQWRQLLHHYYEPFPTVEHYRQILAADPA